MLLIQVIIICVMTLLPIGGMIVHPYMPDHDLQGRYGGMFALGIMMLLLYLVKERTLSPMMWNLRKSVTPILVIMALVFCYWSLKHRSNTIYNERASRVAQEWVIRNPLDKPVTTSPPSFIGSAWCLPTERHCEAARRWYYELKDEEEITEFDKD